MGTRVSCASSPPILASVHLRTIFDRLPHGFPRGSASRACVGARFRMTDPRPRPPLSVPVTPPGKGEVVGGQNDDRDDRCCLRRGGAHPPAWGCCKRSLSW